MDPFIEELRRSASMRPSSSNSLDPALELRRSSSMRPPSKKTLDSSSELRRSSSMRPPSSNSLDPSLEVRRSSSMRPPSSNSLGSRRRQPRHRNSRAAPDLSSTYHLTGHASEAGEAAELGLSRSVSWDPSVANRSRSQCCSAPPECSQRCSVPLQSSTRSDTDKQSNDKIGCWTASRDDVQGWFEEAQFGQQTPTRALFGEFSLVEDTPSSLMDDEAPSRLPKEEVRRAVDEACGLRGAAEAQGLFVPSRPPEVYGPQLDFLKREEERGGECEESRAGAEEAKAIGPSQPKPDVSPLPQPAAASLSEGHKEPTTVEAGMLVASWLNPKANQRVDPGLAARQSASLQPALAARRSASRPAGLHPEGRSRATKQASDISGRRSLLWQRKPSPPREQRSKSIPTAVSSVTKVHCEAQKQLHSFMGKRRTTKVDPHMVPITAHGDGGKTGSQYKSIRCMSSIYLWATVLCTRQRACTGVAVRALSSSLTLALLQLCLLTWTGFHAIFPTCGTHTSCPSGTYCDPFMPTGPRCKDCTHLPSWQGANLSECESLQVPSRIGSEVDRGYVSLAVTDKWDDMANTAKACVAHKYCQETDIMPAQCDHVYFTARIQSSASHMIWLAFISLLFAALLRSSIEQGVLCEEILEHRLRRLAMESQTGGLEPMSRCGWNSIHHLRLALRMRILYAPWQGIGAAASMLVTESITTSHAALTLLAFAIIVMSPELLGWIFLGPCTIRAIETTASEEMLQIRGSPEQQMSTAWLHLYARTTSFACALSLVLLVCNADWLMEHTPLIIRMHAPPMRTCGNLLNVIFGGLLPSFMPFIALTVCAFIRLLREHRQHARFYRSAVLDTVHELFYNLAICFCGLIAVLVAIALVWTALMTAISIAIAMLFSCTCVIAFLHVYRRSKVGHSAASASSSWG